MWCARSASRSDRVWLLQVIELPSFSLSRVTFSAPHGQQLVLCFENLAPSWWCVELIPSCITLLLLLMTDQNSSGVRGNLLPVQSGYSHSVPEWQFSGSVQCARFQEDLRTWTRLGNRLFENNWLGRWPRTEALATWCYLGRICHTFWRTYSSIWTASQSRIAVKFVTGGRMCWVLTTSKQHGIVYIWLSRKELGRARSCSVRDIINDRREWQRLLWTLSDLKFYALSPVSALCAVRSFREVLCMFSQKFLFSCLATQRL